MDLSQDQAQRDAFTPVSVSMSSQLTQPEPQSDLHAMSPLTITPKNEVRKYTAKEWRMHKREITRLYVDNTLSNVMQVMREKHGFDASWRQYRDQFAIWGLKKIILANEMKAKKSAFQLGGYEVTTNINQHNAEYPWPSSDVNIDGDMDRDVNSASTPEEVNCYTPEIGPLTPDAAPGPHASELPAIGWSSSQIPASNLMEAGNRYVNTKAKGKSFTYIVPSAQSSTERENSRKRTISTNAAKLIEGPAKQLSAQQILSGEVFGQRTYALGDASNDANYLESNPGVQYSDHGAMPEYDRSFANYQAKIETNFGYHLGSNSPSTMKDLGAWGSSYPSLASSMAKGPGLLSNAGISLPGGPIPSPRLSTNPALVRTSTLQQTPSSEATPHFYAFPQRAKLDIKGDLDSMTVNWTPEEWEARRRLVLFKRSQSGSTITITFSPVTADERPHNSICISCIMWNEREGGCYVTSADTISLLEQLVAARFTVEEKNRIRRNLEGFRPQTVSKGKLDSEEFFKLITTFPPPKPRNIEKDVKVLRWKDLASALKMIIGKYSTSPSSTLPPLHPPLLTPISSTGYVTKGTTATLSYANDHRGAVSPQSISMKSDRDFRRRSIEQKEDSVLVEFQDKVLQCLISQRDQGAQEFEMESRFRVRWSPSEFMHRQFGDSHMPSIGSVIVLNGTSLNAHAKSCQDYLQDNWPDTYLALLRCLEDGLHGHSAIIKGKNMTLHSWMEGDELILDTVGTGARLVEIAQQLAWLGAALRNSTDDQLKYSEADIRTVKGTEATFEITFKMSPLDKTESSCWHTLFTGSVIAKGFPIAARGQEVGLEISLEMMAALAGVRHAVEYEGGIILKGYSSALFPVKRYKDSIQWHYIENDNHERLPYWAVETRCPGRAMLNEVSMKDLKNTRAFVGWWGITETNLGTKTANYENIDWSSCEQVSRSVRFSGTTMGFQQIMIGEVNFSLGARDGKLHVQRKGPYQRIVQCAARSPVVLYDSSEKRAWLVPSSAVILHIAKTRHYRDPYMNNGEKIEFPSADPSTSNHEAAEKVLREEAAFKLSTHDHHGTQDYCLRDLVQDIWSHFESLLDKNVTKEATSDPELRGTMRDMLQGWEFMDVVDDRSPFRLKETYIEKSSGGWTHLARDIDAIVLFGSGFEDIIRPQEESIAGLCHMWKSVPKGKDYLTASVPMMNQLYEQAGSKLTRKHLTSTHLQWHRGGQLWERCKHTKLFSCACSRLQQVVSGNSIKIGSVSDPGLLEEKGAVIFGQASDTLISTVSELLKPKVNQNGSFYSQPNVELLAASSFSSPGSNLSLEIGTPSILSVSTLPTSDEDDQETKIEDSLKDPISFKLIENDDKRGRSRSLKRSHSGEDLKPIQQPYRRQRKRFTGQKREADIQCKTVNSGTLLKTSSRGSVVTVVEKINGNDKKVSLRYKGNFATHDESNDGFRSSSDISRKDTFSTLVKNFGFPWGCRYHLESVQIVVV